MKTKRKNITHRYTLAAWAAAVALLAMPWKAVATHKVYSPRVEAGVLSLEFRGHSSFDDDDDADAMQGYRVETEYGVNDIWKTAFFGTFEGDADHGVRYTTSGWENIFYFLEEKRSGLGAGLYLEYELAHRADLTDQIELKVLLERGLFGFVNTVNLNFEKGVGEGADEGVEFAYAWRTTHAVLHHFLVGFEAYGGIGEIHDAPPVQEQEHQIGPMLYGEIHLGGRAEVEYNLGVLFGLTEDTPDYVLKWQLEFKLPF